MPRKVVELSVAVPSGRAFFGGGLDNPAGSGSGGAIRSNRSSKRAIGRANPFPRASHRSPEHGHIPPYQRYASALGVPEPTQAPGLATCLSGNLASMELSEGPISTRTRLRRRFGFPLPPTGALAVLERDETTKLNSMAKMSVAAAKQRGAADAAAAAAKQRGRRSRAAANAGAVGSSRVTSHGAAPPDGGWQRARIGP